MNQREAPIYTDSFQLCGWLLEHFDADPGVLARELVSTALALHKHLVLALWLPEPAPELDLADEALILLRALLRLAEASRKLSQDQLLYALERADAIGRQLGGWLRREGGR
jgi:hypothetical protein